MQETARARLPTRAGGRLSWVCLAPAYNGLTTISTTMAKNTPSTAG